jgi:hypothetical protein
MNNVGLQNLIFTDSPRIVQAITTGAAWEVWMQVELVLILRAGGLQAAREVPYPAPNNNLLLDVISQDNAGIYAIELKCESAHNAGPAVMIGINADRQKLQLYYNPAPNPGARWTVGMGYSQAAVQAMNQFANVQGNNAIFAYQNGLGILVATV